MHTVHPGTLNCAANALGELCSAHTLRMEDCAYFAHYLCLLKHGIETGTSFVHVALLRCRMFIALLKFI